MDYTADSLPSVLILLATGVAAVVLCRTLRLPPLVGYLATGLMLGPHALGLASDRETIHTLAE
ncbi:MAG TPA: cation:proton antiporter, partial [Burkholderiales bacterium]|nr:cation:proton antiporter [Burkholderiales bacterium]